jgi:hypothetical protein
MPAELTISSMRRTQRPVGDCARVRRRRHPIVAATIAPAVVGTLG